MIPAIIMALSATVNTLYYNPPMSHAGPKRPERKTKLFVQTVPSAPPSLKMRKQQVVRAILCAIVAAMPAKFTKARKIAVLHFAAFRAGVDLPA
jgi:hypothetical protein